MESQLDKLVKLALLLLLVIAGLFYWVAPKTSLRARMQMNDKLYILTQIVGIMCGTAGLFVIFYFQEQSFELHLWELVIMPYVFIQVYWLTVMKVVKGSDITDEKQEYDMSKAGGLTFGLLFPAMLLLLTFYENGVVSGMLWFPYYIFTSVTLFSAFVLYYFYRS